VVMCEEKSESVYLFWDIHRIFLVDFAPHDMVVTAVVCQAM
jgi:hypothetical protein